MISDQLSLRQRLDQDGPFKSFDRWLNEAVEFTCSKEPKFAQLSQLLVSPL